VAKTEGTAFVLFSQQIFVNKLMQPGIELSTINIFLGAVAVFTAAATIVQIFWPISVPLFLILDFGSVQTGKWEFIQILSFGCSVYRLQDSYYSPEHTLWRRYSMKIPAYSSNKLYQRT
jgi:hypothetical protein